MRIAWKTGARMLGAFLLALLAATLVASAAQSLVNLSVLSGLGLPLSAMIHLQTVVHDWRHFAPTVAVLLGASFLPAFLVAGLLARWLPRARPWLFPLAGAAAVATMLWLMRELVGVTPISATRFPFGFGLFCLAGAFAGWLFATLLRPRRLTT